MARCSKQKMSYTIANSIAVKIWRNDAIQSETSSYVFVIFPLELAVNFTCMIIMYGARFDHVSFFNTVRARVEVVLRVQGKKTRYPKEAMLRVQGTEKQSPKEATLHPKMWRLLLGPFVADKVRVRVRSDVK